MITAAHITKKYGKTQVLKDISFQVAAGERVAIVGNNGCGKTTLMQILAGIQKPDSGELLYFNKNAISRKQTFRELCGYVPQDNPLMEDLTVKDNLKLWAAAAGKDYQNLIDFFDLQPMMKKKVKQLSGGMKRRLSIACALIGWPPVLLMDEPTSALDIFYKESIRKLMKEYQELNGILLITTHDEMEIRECDRCLVMAEGRLSEYQKGERE